MAIVIFLACYVTLHLIFGPCFFRTHAYFIYVTYFEQKKKKNSKHPFQMPNIKVNIHRIFIGSIAGSGARDSYKYLFQCVINKPKRSLCHPLLSGFFFFEFLQPKTIQPFRFFLTPALFACLSLFIW